MLDLLVIIAAVVGGDPNPPKDECPGVAPEVLAHIVEFAEKEFTGGSTYGSVLRKVGKWAKAQEPPVQFTSEQRKCWLKHVKAIRDRSQIRQEAEKRKAEIAKEKSRTDFRKARWGMTKGQVKATERGSPYKEPDGNLLYLTEIFGAPASIAYLFTNGILTMAGLEFPDAQKNVNAIEQAVKKIDEQATKESGKPIKKRVEGDIIYTVWQSKRTRTVVMISVTTTTSMDVTVMYASVKHNTLPDLD